MKSASGAMVALLANNVFLMADLLTITTSGGAIFRLTSCDIDLVVSGNTFLHDSIQFKRGKTRIVVGIEVDTLDLTLFAVPSQTIGGIPALAAISNGYFDGATVELERVFMATWGDTSAGTIKLFKGRVSECSVKRTEAQLTVKSALELLNIMMPRNLYMPGCQHTLFAAGCGLSKASFQSTGTVTIDGLTSSFDTNITAATGFFDQGTIEFTSGLNTGVIRNVKSQASSGDIFINYPLPNAAKIGDQFKIFPGCDKTQATCTAKFNNIAGFRGFPFIPMPETSL